MIASFPVHRQLFVTLIFLCVGEPGNEANCTIEICVVLISTYPGMYRVAEIIGVLNWSRENSKK